MPSVLKETQSYIDKGLEKVDGENMPFYMPFFFYKITIKENIFIKVEAKHKIIQITLFLWGNIPVFSI